ncbi:MAG: glycosyltransferase family 39 protein [Sulfurovum sp.]|nr:glycosyltransferase family 39 protein [Sulfurovum sp.]
MKNSVYINNFLFILFIYFCIHLLIRVFISPNVGLDEAEQILLTQSFAWGYNSQPPLYTWIQYVYFEFFGTNIFALSFFKNTLLFLTHVFVYKSAKLATNNSTLALIATASLILLPQISWESQRALTHSVLLTSISSMIIYVIFKIKYTVDKIHIGYYFLLGLLISVGMLTKYSFSIFIFSVFIASLLDKKLRSFILKKELAITLTIIIVLLSPHFLWFIENIKIVTSSTIGKLNPNSENFSFLIGIIDLFKAILAFLAPLLIFAILIFRKSLDKPGNKFLFHFFITVIITLILFTIVTGSTNFKDRWMQPYFFLMVIYIASKINIENLKKLNIILYFRIVYFFMFVIIAVLIGRVYFPDITKRHSRLNYPFYTLSQQIKSLGFNQGFIIAGDKSIAGNMKLNFLDSTVSAENFEKKLDDSQKILIIWEKKFPPQAEKYKHLIKTKKIIKSKYLFSDRNDYKLNIAIVQNENKGY